MSRWPKTFSHVRKMEYRETESGLTSLVSSRTTVDYRSQVSDTQLHLWNKAENSDTVKESKTQGQIIPPLKGDKAESGEV